MAKVNSAVGIEYDSHEIRAVELTKNADGSYQVSAFGTKQYNDNMFSNGMIAEPALFAQTLNELISEGRFKANLPTVIGVNNENVIMRYATFPKVPDDKLRGVITMQAQDFIPVPINELGLDFVVIDEDKDDDDQSVLNVLLVGARSIMLENIVTNFNNSKFELVDIDSAFLAWCRAAIEKYSTETIGFFKLTDDALNFVAIVDGEIKMVRSISIPDRASLEVKKAFNESDDVTDMQIQAIVDFLYSELSSSINYFQMQGDKFIEKVLFSASCATEQQILAGLSEKSFVPVSIPSFYEDYMTSEFNPARFAGCISLAKAALEG